MGTAIAKAFTVGKKQSGIEVKCMVSTIHTGEFDTYVDKDAKKYTTKEAVKAARLPKASVP